MTVQSFFPHKTIPKNIDSWSKKMVRLGPRISWGFLCIGGTICTCREIQCLQYAGFFHFYFPMHHSKKKCKYFISLHMSKYITSKWLCQQDWGVGLGCWLYQWGVKTLSGATLGTDMHLIDYFSKRAEILNSKSVTKYGPRPPTMQVWTSPHPTPLQLGHFLARLTAALSRFSANNQVRWRKA